MAKQPKWTEEEKRAFFNLLEEGKSWEEMSVSLGRSVNSLKIIRARLLAYEPLCVGCGVRLLRPEGAKKWKPAKRCPDCIALRKKEYYRRYFAKSKNSYFPKKRNLIRFGGNREKAIERDGGKCVECGMTREEHRKRFGNDITVDHKDGGDRDTKKLNNKMSNLQTLCLPCHGKKDWQRRRKDWSMCGAVLKKYWAERRATGGFQFRCPCGEMMRIMYDPIKNYRRLQKERCGKCR